MEARFMTTKGSEMLDSLKQIGKLLGHSDGVFPKECALRLLDLARRKALLDDVLVTLACVLPIAAWAVNWAVGNDDGVVAMDVEAGLIAINLAKELGMDAGPRAQEKVPVPEAYRAIAANVLGRVQSEAGHGVLNELRTIVKGLAE